MLVIPAASGVSDARDAQPVPTCLGHPATITGTDGHDVLLGTPGDDRLSGGRRIDLGTGELRVSLGERHPGRDRVDATSGDDVCGEFEVFSGHERC